MKTVLLAIGFLHAVAQAVQYEATNVVGSNPKQFQAASLNPNVTVATTLEFGSRFTFSLRINVTDVAVDDATDSSGQPIPGAHLVDTTYDLTWPGNISLDAALAKASDYVGSTTHRLCQHVIDLDLPLSVSDRYNPSNPGDCTSALGNACVSAIFRSFTINDVEDSGCPTAALLLSAPECQDIVGPGTTSDISGIIGGTPNVTNQTYSAGTAFFSFQTEAFVGDNQAPVKTESRRLHIAALSLVDGMTSQGQSMATDLICLVADSQGDGSTSGSMTSTSSDVAGPTAIAAGGAVLVAGIGLIAGMI